MAAANGAGMPVGHALSFGKHRGHAERATGVRGAEPLKQAGEQRHARQAATDECERVVIGDESQQQDPAGDAQQQIP